MKYQGRRQTDQVIDVRGKNSKERYANLVKEETTKALKQTERINNNPDTMGYIRRDYQDLRDAYRQKVIRK